MAADASDRGSRAGAARSEPSHPQDPLDALLAKQIAYYRALACEYEQHTLTGRGADELRAALESFDPSGSVLELACGTGIWTAQLVRHAATVTAIDASPEMLAITGARVTDERLRLIRADVLTWKPDRRYDVVVFGFWLSHVPLERFERFWALVADCLTPDGRVFFVDDAHRTPEELIAGDSGSTVRRRLNDGSEHQIFKVAHTPAELERRLAALGWQITVTPTAGPFFWGAGGRGRPRRDREALENV